MTARSASSAIDLAAARLRAAVLEVPEGAFLGSEDALQQRLDVSRPTMRQAARLVEREGLLKVRRGNQGGYFGARPDAGFVETTVAAYLEVLKARPEDLAKIATALWVEAVRAAAELRTADTAALAQRFRREIRAIADNTGFSEILALEQKICRHVFRLVDSPYIELIFNINANFTRRQMPERPADRDGTDAHLAFVQAWRRARLMELEAVSDGDVEVAVLAAKRCRQLIHHRIWPQAQG